MQRGTNGTRARPSTFPRLWHACGRVEAQTVGSDGRQLDVVVPLVVVWLPLPALSVLLLVTLELQLSVVVAVVMAVVDPL